MKLPRYVQGFLDRHGRPRHYLRRPGHKRVRLPGIPWTPEFMAAYEAALAGKPEPVEISARRTLPGTINSLIVAYYKSDAFLKALAPETQRMRRNILERFRAEHGDKRVVALEHRHVIRLLEERKPHAQKNWLKTLRGLMQFAIAEGYRPNDPTANVKVAKVKSRGHMTWGDEQIALYRKRHPVGSTARPAIELLLNVAARRGDVHKLGPSIERTESCYGVQARRFAALARCSRSKYCPSSNARSMQCRNRYRRWHFCSVTTEDRSLQQRHSETSLLIGVSPRD